MGSAMGCEAAGTPAMGTEEDGDCEDAFESAWSMRVICSGVSALTSGVGLGGGAEGGDIAPAGEI